MSLLSNNPLIISASHGEPENTSMALLYKYNKKEGKIDLLSHIYSREILFTSICWFRKEEADSTNFSSASVV